MTPIGSPALLMDRRDLLGQHRIGLLPRRDATAPPGIEAGAGHAQHAAQQSHRVRGLLREDEPVAGYPLGSTTSPERTRPRHFFRISRSWRSTWFSRLSRVSSARSAVVSSPGAPRPASISAYLTQLRNVCSLMPRSRAIWACCARRRGRAQPLPSGTPPDTVLDSLACGLPSGTSPSLTLTCLQNRVKSNSIIARLRRSWEDAQENLGLGTPWYNQRSCLHLRPWHA